MGKVSPDGLGVGSEAPSLLGPFLLQDLDNKFHASQLLTWFGATLLHDVHHLAQFLQGCLLPLHLRVVVHWKGMGEGMG